MFQIPETILDLDKEDPLAAKRNEFILPEGIIYLDGNSLGPLPRLAQQRIQQVTSQQWGEDLIHSWNKHNWIDLPFKIGEKIAPLIGAESGQVICCDSISINLFKLLACALDLNPGRNIVLSEQGNFPTDLYMVQGLSELIGEQRCQLKEVEPQHLVESITQETAVVLLTQVDFRSGKMHDIEYLTSAAHAAGALVIWDLAHSAGAVPLHLDRDQVDFALGCGYKYLNGGPGAPGFVYVAQRHQAEIKQPLSGWFGHKTQFAFESRYEAADDVRQMLSGTPSIISMSALDAALEVFNDVNMAQLREKSIALSEMFYQRVDDSPSLQALHCISPNDVGQRGSQLAYSHEYAFAISRALIERKVIVDFRAPNIIRFGFTPMFTRYQDVWSAVEILSNIIETKSFMEERYQVRAKVT